MLDDYVFKDSELHSENFKTYGPSLGWPESSEEPSLPWRSADLGGIDLAYVPRKHLHGEE